MSSKVYISCHKSKSPTDKFQCDIHSVVVTFSRNKNSQHKSQGAETSLGDLHIWAPIENAAHFTG